MGKLAVHLLGVLAIVALVLVFSSSPAEADASDLDSDFYSDTCPHVHKIVRRLVRQALRQDTRIAASLLRLQFHDCFVGGCDASILLDPPANDPKDTEKVTPPNVNSVRGYEVIDTIKAELEKKCPGVVSCADIITLASLYGVVQSGGPWWSVPLGRRDSLVNHKDKVTDLIGPDFNLTTIKEKYAAKNFTNVGAVALTGAHTIGLVRCIVLQNRLYNFNDVAGRSDPSVNATLLAKMKKLCPQTNNGDAGNVTQGLDLKTNQTFDNFYFQNLLLNNGKLFADQQLLSAASAAHNTAVLVRKYADDQDAFFNDFADSMFKMGNLGPLLTGKNGQIRKNCRVVNSRPRPVIQEVVDTTPRKDSEMLRVFKKAVEEVLKDMDVVAAIGEQVERLVEVTVDGALHPSV